MPINVDVRVNNAAIKELIQDLQTVRSLQGQTAGAAGGPAVASPLPFAGGGAAFTGVGSPGPIQGGRGATGPAPVLPPTPNIGPTGPPPQLGGGGGGRPGGGRAGGGGRAAPAPAGGGFFSNLGRTGPVGFARGFLGLSVFAGGAYLLGSSLRRSLEGEAGREMTVADVAQRYGGRFGGVNAITQGGSQYGFGPTGGTEFFERFGAEAGGYNLGRNFSGVLRGEQLTRAFGFSPGEGAESFGQASRQFGGGGGMNHFAEQIATAVQKGQLQGLQGEVFSSILEVNKELNRRIGATTSEAGVNAGRLTALSAILGRSHISSLMGAEGMRTVEGIEGAVRSNNVIDVPNMTKFLAAQAGGQLGYSPMDIATIQLRGLADPRFGSLVSGMIGQAGNLPGGTGPGGLGQFALAGMNVPLDSAAFKTLQAGFSANSNFGNTDEGKAALNELIKTMNGSDAAKIRQQQMELEVKTSEAMQRLMPILLKLDETLNKILDFLQHPMGTIAKMDAEHPMLGGIDRFGASIWGKFTGAVNDIGKGKGPDIYGPGSSDYGTRVRFLAENPEWTKGVKAAGFTRPMDEISAIESEHRKPGWIAEQIKFQRGAPGKNKSFIEIIYHDDAGNKHPVDVPISDARMLPMN